LDSDLSVPLPLHISLSRPLSLTTSTKDAFLRAVQDRIGACRLYPFGLFVTGADWYWGGEYGSRSFLVLRLREVTPPTDGEPQSGPLNHSLATLLAACNAVASEFGQTLLYARRASRDESDNVQSRPAEELSADHDAFHISIAWSLAAPTPELESATAAAQAGRNSIVDITVPVDGVKVKIGNVVTHVPLGQRPQETSATLLGL
jgi:U6 snRNA phosphodiesterase